MSKRVEIINTIVQKLKETGEFPGGVYKVQLDHPDVPAHPAACVIPGASDYSPLTNRDYVAGSPDGIDGWNIHIICLAKVPNDTDKQGLLTDEMERLAEVVMQSLFEDGSLGLSYVQNTYLASIFRLYEWEKNVGMIELIWQVKYDFEKTNP